VVDGPILTCGVDTVPCDRCVTDGTSGFTVWLTGLPAAGKSTLAALLVESLRARSFPTQLVDGDALRNGVSSDLDYSLAGRAEAVRRAGAMALDLARAGSVAVVAMVSPIAKNRNDVRRNHELEDLGMVEIWISTPLEVCERRDPKGLYRRARLGTVRNMTGIDSPYEPPTNADLALSLVHPTPGDALNQVLGLIESVTSSDTDDPPNL